MAADENVFNWKVALKKMHQLVTDSPVHASTVNGDAGIHSSVAQSSRPHRNTLDKESFI